MMKSLLCAFLVCCALPAVAGCSGGVGATPSTEQAQPQRVSPNAFGEKFKARFKVTNQTCLPGQSGNTTFSAKGTASGPYGGTFTASGTWNFYQAGGPMKWVFSEQFKITGAKPIDGTITGNGSGKTAQCKTFAAIAAPGKLKYHLGTATGSATTTLVKNASEISQHLL